ncbi:MAG TPA: tetratricopeptide repeat protein [Thermoanaerobaculia bacterium]|nr:tetratricopeptide repeat protein [Thermoanaerobaculia bacterium]
MRARRRTAAALLVLAAAACTKTKPKTSAELLLNERMAQVLLRDGRPAEAEKAFKECLKDDPKNPEVLDGLGVAMLMQARYKDSLVPFDKAVGYAPENGAFRNNRGVALMELGEFKRAQDDFLVAAASQSSDDRLSATINLGRLFQRQGDYAAAESQFSSAIAHDPKNYAAFVGRAVAKESAGNLEGAAEDYLTAVKLEPTNADANLRLGMVLISLQKLDLGRRYLQRAVDLDPAGDVGARARLLLEKEAVKGAQ